MPTAAARPCPPAPAASTLRAPAGEGEARTTEEEFAAVLAAAVGRMSEFSAVAEGAVVTVCAGEGHRFFVERRYRRYLDLAEAERPAALQEMAADLVSRTRRAEAVRERAQDWSWASGRLFPQLAGTVHTPSDAAPLLHDDWLPGIEVHYILYAPEYRFRWMVLEASPVQWGVSAEEVRRGAFAHLARYTVAMQEYASGFWRFAVQPEAFDFLNCAQLLIPERMQDAARLCGSHRLLVSVPDVAVVFVFREDHPRKRSMRLAAARAHAISNLPVCGDFLQWRDGRWHRPAAIPTRST